MSLGASLPGPWGPPAHWVLDRRAAQPAHAPCTRTLHTRVLAHQEGSPLQRGGGGLRAGHDHVQDAGHHIVLGKQAIGVSPLQGGGGLG